MSNLVEHAKIELECAGLFSKDSDYEGMLAESVMELIELFSKQNHSGASASMVSGIFDKLSRFQPLQPLTGKDGEWVEVAEGLFQNKRCSRVFKDKDKAWDINGKIFEDPDGSRWTNKDSHTVIAFPYVPKSEIVKRGSQ